MNMSPEFSGLVFLSAGTARPICPHGDLYSNTSTTTMKAPYSNVSRTCATTWSLCRSTED